MTVADEVDLAARVDDEEQPAKNKPEQHRTDRTMIFMFLEWANVALCLLNQETTSTEYPSTAK